QSFLALAIGPVGALLIVRFLIGVGEAAALPNFNRTVANWFAPSERGLGIGVSIGGIGFGSAMTPPLVVWLMIHYGWKSAFYFTGVLGVVVAGLWFWISRDSPADHPGVNRAELDWIMGGENQIEPVLLSPKGSFKEVLLSPSVWFLTASYTMLGYIAYIYLSWFFIYLVNVRHFEVLKGSFLSTAPFLAMALFCPLGGWLSDRMVRKYGPIRGQKSVGASGMFLTSGLIYAGALAVDPYTAILFLSLGAGILYSTVGAYWSSTIEISREHSGALSGLMNMGANLGGTLSPILTPYLGEKYGWPLALSVAAGAAFLGGLLWLAVGLQDALSPKEPFS
ncbi:MAG TPA: MFS transporter, partial [Nitrospiria bacterium]|nr:MFS transporter [Nitrospiria bacterium]